MIRRSAWAILAMLACALCAARAAAADADALRRDALAAEDARFHATTALADLRAREQKLPEARALYLEALQLRPDDPIVAASLLDVLRRQGDWAARLPVIEQQCARHPGDADLAFEFGECLWRLGRADEGRRAWAAMLRRFPDDVDSFDRVVDFCAAEKLPADARAVLDERRKRFGDTPETRLVDAQLALMQGNPGAAVDALLAALDAGLDSSDRDRAESMLVDAAAQCGRTNEIAKHLAAALSALDAKIADRKTQLLR